MARTGPEATRSRTEPDSYSVASRLQRSLAQPWGGEEPSAPDSPERGMRFLREWVVHLFSPARARKSGPQAGGRGPRGRSRCLPRRAGTMSTPTAHRSLIGRVRARTNARGYPALRFVTLGGRDHMRIRLVPREESFFDLFEQMAGKVWQGAKELLALLENYTDLDKRVGRILDIEHEGDEITHEVIQRLNTTFITPFDREDIHRLASSLDDVLDHIEAAGEYLQLHRIENPLPQMVSLTETLSEAANKTASAMPRL